MLPAVSFSYFTAIERRSETLISMIIIIIIIIITTTTAIEFSLCGSSTYTSTDKTNNIHKRNNAKHSKYKYTYYQNTHT